MKLVAAARLNRAQERIVSARPFVDGLELLLSELSYLSSQGGAALAHPFLTKRDHQRLDVVVVTSDRGLCGGFNANVIRRTVQFLREHPDSPIHLWLVGKKGRDFFRRYPNVEKEYVGVFQNLGYAQAEVIGGDVIDAFLKQPTRAFVVISNTFKTRMQQQVVVKPLLPVLKVDAVKPRLDFIYEPDREQILNELLPRTLKAQIYRILLDSQAAELAARMTAMDNATNNARELIASLTLTMNNVRQAAITKEIAEIVGGAEALQN
jgi:F-type H+-transporting ATPase subunit gamma